MCWGIWEFPKIRGPNIDPEEWSSFCKGTYDMDPQFVDAAIFEVHDTLALLRETNQNVGNYFQPLIWAYYPQHGSFQKSEAHSKPHYARIPITKTPRQGPLAGPYSEPVLT